MNKIIQFVVFCSLSVLIACGSGSTDEKTTTQPEVINWQPVASDWQKGDAVELGFDAARLTAVYNKAAGSGSLQSLLVVKDSQLVAEAYFSGQTSSVLFHERSVTKTVIAMLVGIAIEDGLINSVDQTIGSFFIDDYPNLSAAKQEITIRQLLSMSSGFEWNESQASAYGSWATSSDPQGYLLNRELVNTPGSSFTYNSAGVHLLSVILAKVSGKTTLEYAQEKIFTQLGISNLKWEKLADNFHNGGAGLQLRTQDLAKLGLLLLKQGVWQQQVVIPAVWVQQAATIQLNIDANFGAFTNINYGYLWWLGNVDGRDVQLAWGWGGQFILTVPSENLVLICNSTWQLASVSEQEKVALDILLNDILAALL